MALAINTMDRCSLSNIVHNEPLLKGMVGSDVLAIHLIKDITLAERWSSAVIKDSGHAYKKDLRAVVFLQIKNFDLKQLSASV